LNSVAVSVTAVRLISHVTRHVDLKFAKTNLRHRLFRSLARASNFLTRNTSSRGLNGFVT